MIQWASNFLKQSMLLTAGSILMAIAAKSFIVPHDLLAGGITGFALLVYYQWDRIPLGVIYFAINIPIFALGWKFVGRRFIAYSLWGLTIYSTCLILIKVEIDLSDSLLATLVAAAMAGTGTALILRSYGASGGADIICVVLNKLFSISLGTGSILINAVLLVLAAFYFPMEKVIYTMVFVFIAAQFTNRVFQSLSERRTAIIISDHWQEIVQSLAAHQIGTTVIAGQGGFQGEPHTVLYSVLAAHSASRLKQAVTKIDPAAFIAIMPADDVTGVEVGNQPHW
jgi:uncharacterized membrane-anchored protein YitT (DUF2179 family)